MSVKPNVRFAALILLLVTTVGLGAIALFSDSDKWWRDLADSVARVPPTIAAVLIALSLLNYVLRYIRWAGYLEEFGYRIPRRANALIYLAGFSMTLTPGKVGEAVRTMLLIPYGVSAEHSLAAFFIDRLMDFAAVVLLAFGLLTMWHLGAMALVVSVSATAAIVFIVWHPRFLPRIFDRLSRIPFGTRWDSTIRRIADIFAAVQGMVRRRFVSRLSISVAAWALEGVGLWLVVHHFQSDVNMITVLGIYGASVLLGLMTFLPGGVGGTEFGMTVLLMQAGLSLPDAAVATGLSRAATLWFGFLLGVVACGLLIQARKTSLHN